jgi:hypothetical protein
MADFLNGLLRGLIELLFEVGCYFTARWVLPLVSLGRVHVAPWTGARRPPKGSIVIRHGLAAFLGFMIWVVAIGMGVVVYRQF